VRYIVWLARLFKYWINSQKEQNVSKGDFIRLDKCHQVFHFFAPLPDVHT